MIDLLKKTFWLQFVSNTLKSSIKHCEKTDKLSVIAFLYKHLNAKLYDEYETFYRAC